MKQVPLHPRDRLKQLTKDDDVVFVKQVPLHPRDRLKELTKDDDVVFIKQVHLHPRLKKKTIKLKLINPGNKMKMEALQIAAENAETLLKGKFNFSPQKILNKTMLFDTSRINEEKVMDKFLEALPVNKDELYILHKLGTNAFTLKREDRKQTKNFTKSKNYF